MSAVLSSRKWTALTTAVPTPSVASVQPNGGSPVTRLSVLIAVRRSVTWTALTVVSPGLTVASEKIIENAAVTDWTPLIASLHVAVPLQAPRQVLKLVPVGGWAASGAIGYAGTLAMGRTTILYFERGKRKPEPEELSEIRRWAREEAEAFLARRRQR